MIKQLYWLLLFCGATSFAQELAVTLNLNLNKSKAVFQVVNAPATQTVMFFADKTDISAIRLDKNMNPIDSIYSKRPDKVYDKMAGSVLDGDNPRLFWTSSDSEKICLQSFDFDKHQATLQYYELSFDGERFIETFSSPGRFMILAVLRKSSTLKCYVFGKDGKMETRTISLKSRFFDRFYKPTDLYGVLAENFLPLDAPYSLQKITGESPVSLTEGAKRRKAYFNDEALTLTFDNNKKYTQLIRVNLTDYTAIEQVFLMPFIVGTDFSGDNSNSFLTPDGKLFQMKASSSRLSFTLKDQQGKLMKDYTIDPDSPIDFKNSDIVQENGEYGKTRTLDKTAQFIRKTNNENSGLSVCELNGNYLVTLGSVSDQPNYAVMIGGMTGGLAGALIAAAIWNPTFSSFNAYQRRKVVTINCLFDLQGNHVPGAFDTLAFDKMRGFIHDLKDTSSETVFKFEKDYYLGYYKTDEKKYFIYKFKE